MSTKDGCYVYPRVLPNALFPPDECLKIIEDHAGITLRDHLAAMAMQGMLSNTDASDELMHLSGRLAPTLAINAYEFADAMIAAREAKP